MKLRRVEITSIGNSWTLQWDTGFYVHIGDINSFAKLLRKLKAADNKNDPKSHRSLKYLDMAKEVTEGDNIVWIWDHILKTIKEEKMRKDDTKKDSLIIEKNFRLPGTDVILEAGDEIRILTDASKTAKCPTCGGKYLVQTGYCVGCKKKVADSTKKESAVSNEKDPDSLHIKENSNVREYTYYYTDDYEIVRVIYDEPFVIIQGFNLYSQTMTLEQFNRIFKVKWQPVDLKDWSAKEQIKELDKVWGRMNPNDILIQENKGKKSLNSKLKEEVDATKVIKDLAKSYGDSNEEQGKLVNLMKGLAFSDDPEANKFMQALDKWTTTYANKMKD